MRAEVNEHGLDASAFTVGFSLQSVYCGTSTAPGVVSCVQQSPATAGLQWRIPSHGARIPSHAFRTWKPSWPLFAIVLGLLPPASCLT